MSGSKLFKIISIVISEDRTKFANLMEEIGEPVAKRFTIRTKKDVDKLMKEKIIQLVKEDQVTLPRRPEWRGY